MNLVSYFFMVLHVYICREDDEKNFAYFFVNFCLKPQVLASVGICWASRENNEKVEEVP